MDDIAEQLAIRDRFLRNLYEKMTPAERLQRMRELQARSWAILQSSPEGYAAFMRRNFKQRAIDIEHDRG